MAFVLDVIADFIELILTLKVSVSTSTIMGIKPSNAMTSAVAT